MMESGQENKSVTNKIALNVNEPFSNQTEYKKIIEDYSNIPVPEVTLHRSLRLAEVAIREELSKRTQEVLVGLQIYIRFRDKTTKELGEVYTISWGEIDTIEPDTDKVENEHNENIDDSQWPLSVAFINSLAQRLTEVLREDIPTEETSQNEPVVAFLCVLASTPSIHEGLETFSLRLSRRSTGKSKRHCCKKNPKNSVVELENIPYCTSDPC